MKSSIITAAVILLTTALLIAQGNLTVGRGGNHWQRFWGWDTKKPPPLSLQDAYAVALSRVGPATNKFFCVSANTLEMTNYYFRGWAFKFSNTNGQVARIEVSFDRELRLDPASESLLK